MANLIIISGPQAVGKMTVAEALRDKTGYRLMTNHDSIELSDIVFERKSDAQKEFNLLIRNAAFETAVKYDVDLIFTFESIDSNFFLKYEIKTHTFSLVEYDSISHADLVNAPNDTTLSLLLISIGPYFNSKYLYFLLPFSKITIG